MHNMYMNVYTNVYTVIKGREHALTQIFSGLGHWNASSSGEIYASIINNSWTLANAQKMLYYTSTMCTIPSSTHSTDRCLKCSWPIVLAKVPRASEMNTHAHILIIIQYTYTQRRSDWISFCVFCGYVHVADKRPAQPHIVLPKTHIQCIYTHADLHLNWLRQTTWRNVVTYCLCL